MAESGQSRAGEDNHDLANSSTLDGAYPAEGVGSGVVAGAQKTRLAGSIVIGILIGAVAAFLVGGLVGVHENGTGTAIVDQTAIVQQSAP